MKRMTQALQVLFAASCGKAELYREKIASRLQGMREFYGKTAPRWPRVAGQMIEPSFGSCPPPILGRQVGRKNGSKDALISILENYAQMVYVLLHLLPSYEVE
jgi:hypothetical protein